MRPDPERQEPEQADDRPWDERIFERIDPGVDGTIIEENLRRSPAERLRRMQMMLRFMESARGVRNLLRE